MTKIISDAIIKVGQTIQALGAGGISIADDAGNLGIYVADGGNIGVNGTPVRQLTVVQKTGSNKGILITGKEQYQEANGDDTSGVWIGAGVNRTGNRQAWIGDYDNLGSNINGFFRLYSGSGFAAMGGVKGDGSGELPIIINENAQPVGIGSVGATPRGTLHAHNGVGGLLFVTKTAIDATAQTILPNGTGDVTKGITFLAIVADSSGSIAFDTYSLTPAVSRQIITATGNSIRLYCNTDGSLTTARDAGTRTFTLVLLAIWL